MTILLLVLLVAHLRRRDTAAIPTDDLAVRT
jgi:hypothetical protein